MIRDVQIDVPSNRRSFSVVDVDILSDGVKFRFSELEW